jgi:hypothetical protein
MECKPSPEYAALFETENKVVRLFDYLYFELCRVQTPAVNAFIEPFQVHQCFYRETAHVGTELDSIGKMWGTSPELLLKAACDALEDDNSASEREFEPVLAVCENTYNMDATAAVGDSLREGEGALAMSMRARFAHKTEVEKISQLKAKLAAA